MMSGNDLDSLLARLQEVPVEPASSDFMDEVWARAGALSARRDGQTQLALFIGFIVIGMGAGGAVAHAPAIAEPPAYVVSSEAALAPATLLHVEP